MNVFIFESAFKFNTLDVLLMGSISTAEQYAIGIGFMLLALGSGFISAVTSSNKLTWRRCLILWPHEIDNDVEIDLYCVRQALRAWFVIMGVLILIQGESPPPNARVSQLDITQSTALGPRCKRWTLTPDIVNVQLHCYHEDKITKQTIPMSSMGSMGTRALLQHWRKLGVEQCEGETCLKMLTHNVALFVETVPISQLTHHLNSILYSLQTLRYEDVSPVPSIELSTDVPQNETPWRPFQCWIENAHCVDGTAP